MLILSRKSGESLMIGDDVVVTVLDTTQNQIRIGISAPRDIAVHREEIYLKVLAEKSQQEQPNTPSNSQPQHMQEPTPAAMRIKA